MLKETKIKELVYIKVANIINPELTKYGFKYFKSKKCFAREEREFAQVIHLNYPASPLVGNEDTGQLFLVFSLSFQIEIPGYEKWMVEKIGQKPNLAFKIEVLYSQIELLQNDFEEDNFYNPGKAQAFKHGVTISLANRGQQNTEIVPLTNILEERIPALISKLSENCDVLKIFDARKYPSQYTYLLAYGGYYDLAVKQFDRIYLNYIREIEEKSNSADPGVGKLIESLDVFIKTIDKVIKQKYINPYTRSIKSMPLQGCTFNFSTNIRFTEILRLDISQFSIKYCHINFDGDILLFDNQRIIKLNSNGQIVFEQVIEPSKGFDKIYWNIPTGIIEEKMAFYINNYIITRDNEFIKLNLPLKNQKNKKLQNSHITDFAYSNKENKYLVLYQGCLLTFDEKGSLEKSLDLGQGLKGRIIIEKEWIITGDSDLSKTILNFDGQIIATYGHGNGNSDYEFSNSFKYVFFFFHSTKSQLYDLSTTKKETLWAHPTFMPGYIEKMYSDIHNNFGINIAKFSPDDKYIVAGAEHGKYVAWILPTLERIELIPQATAIEKLTPLVTTSFSEQSSQRITKAELITLNEKTFLKNRGNDISNIIFFENGDIFITEIDKGKFILSWDRNFNNLSFARIDSRLNYHSKKYLSQITKTELVIYN